MPGHMHLEKKKVSRHFQEGVISQWLALAAGALSPGTIDFVGRRRGMAAGNCIAHYRRDTQLEVRRMGYYHWGQIRTVAYKSHCHCQWAREVDRGTQDENGFAEDSTAHDEERTENIRQEAELRDDWRRRANENIESAGVGRLGSLELVNTRRVRLQHIRRQGIASSSARRDSVGAPRM